MKAVTEKVLPIKSSQSSNQSTGKDFLLLGEFLDIRLDFYFETMYSSKMKRLESLIEGSLKTLLLNAHRVPSS